MFSGGAVVTTVAFLCCFFIITVSKLYMKFPPVSQLANQNIQAGIQGAARAGQWSIRESFLAIIITNTPLIFPFIAKFYNRVSSTLSSSASKRESFFPRSSPGSPGSHGLSFGSLGHKKVCNPYSIPEESAWEKTLLDRTINGEKDWEHSKDLLFIPNSKTDIEAGSATCLQRVTMEESKNKDVVIVSTEIGIRSDDGLPSRSFVLLNPKPAVLAP
jgi:hypothetical protein